VLVAGRDEGRRRVDYSARIQSVHAETNPRYHALLTRASTS